MSSSTNNDGITSNSSGNTLAATLAILQNSSDETELLASMATLRNLSPKRVPSCTDDMATSSIEYHAIPFHIGLAHLKLPSSDSLRRKKNVMTANVYFDEYLRNCNDVGLMNDDVVKEHHLLLDLLDDNDDGNNNGKLTAGQIREMKMARHQRKVNIQNRIRELECRLKRRIRLEIQYDEELEGWDGDGITRELEFARLRLYAEESLDEMQSSKLELEMLDMAIRFEGVRSNDSNNNDKPPSDARMIPNGREAESRQHDDDNNNNNNNNKLPAKSSLNLTQITQDPISGQLNFNKQQLVNGTLQSIGLPTTSSTQIKRQQITEGVFQPSWNLPTMSLQELAERETADAMARSKSQREYEARQKESMVPRRYEQLVRDGKEDDAHLVDASAVLDRAWDDWKEENPRGSGNKMGERGDRNF